MGQESWNLRRGLRVLANQAPGCTTCQVSQDKIHGTDMKSGLLYAYRLRIRAWLCVRVCVCMCMSAGVWVCTSVCVYVCVSVSTCDVSLHVWLCVCMHACYFSCFWTEHCGDDSVVNGDRSLRDCTQTPHVLHFTDVSLITWRVKGWLFSSTEGFRVSITRS